MYTRRIHSATTRALGIPEVMGLICGSSCLSQSDLANLCQVSRFMSDISMPPLWRHVTAEVLLELIYSANVCCRSNGTIRSIILDEHSIDDQTFAKFHLYAPYVRTLDIYSGKHNRCYTVHGWDILRDEMEAQGHPLLPNLKTLRFLNISHSYGLDELKWISIFATCGVNEVSISPSRLSGEGQIPFSIASTILKTLVDLCPSIQMLDLSTNDFPMPLFLEDVRLQTAFAHQPTRPWYQELELLTQLRCLTVSDGWLCPDSLLALSNLPELEFLRIVPGPLDDFLILDMDPVLPTGMFPRLTELSILGFDGYDIGTILSVVEMSRKITVMKLELRFDDRVDDTHWELGQMFGGLRNALCLRELHVSFPFKPEEGERSVNAYDSIEDMGPHLSLEYVGISGIRINRGCCHIEKLAALWPNVQTLSMPSQSASFKELEEFAALPSLRHLTVNLNLKYPEHLVEPDFERAPLETLTSSGPVRLSTNYKTLSLSAHDLLVLWPSLERVSWSDEDPTRTQMAGFFNSEVLRFNREFQLGEPREVARLSATKSAKEMKSVFKLVKDGLEEVNSDSDADTDPGEGSETE